MLCEICHRNEATIHIKEVRDGKIVSHDFCAACAKLKEAQGELGVLGINLAEVLFKFGKLAHSAEAEPGKEEAAAVPEKDDAAEAPEAEGAARCPVCGWTAKRISETGCFGCPECYRSFAPLIGRTVGRFQRGEFHLGKRPGAAALGRSARLAEIAKLKRELARRIDREEYEAAAVCRDRINALLRADGDDGGAAEPSPAGEAR